MISIILFFTFIFLLNFLLDYIPKVLWIKKCGKGDSYIFIEKNNLILQVGIHCKKIVSLNHIDKIVYFFTKELEPRFHIQLKNMSKKEYLDINLNQFKSYNFEYKSKNSNHLVKVAKEHHIQTIPLLYNDKHYKRINKLVTILFNFEENLTYQFYKNGHTQINLNDILISDLLITNQDKLIKCTESNYAIISSSCPIGCYIIDKTRTLNQGYGLIFFQNYYKHTNDYKIIYVHDSHNIIKNIKKYFSEYKNAILVNEGKV